MNPIKRTYKGYEYFQKDGAWTVRNPDGDDFIVALDESKSTGDRTYNPNANNPQICRDYIDWITGAPKNSQKTISTPGATREMTKQPYCDLCQKRVPKVIRYPLLNIPDLCPMHHDDVMSVKEEIQ